MTSKRKHAKDLERWETETRAWAADTARDLALDLYYGRDTNARPFRVGVVLDPGERVWVETPLYCTADIPALSSSAGLQPPPRPWLVTNRRVVARLGDDRLYGWRWERVVGCRVDLTPGREAAALDFDAQRPIVWTGPGVAPLAVAAVFRLHGARAMLEHPGLVSLRVPVSPRTSTHASREDIASLDR